MEKITAKKLFTLVWTTLFIIFFLFISVWVFACFYFDIDDMIADRYQGSIIMDLVFFLGWLSFLPVMKLVIKNYRQQMK